jgi:hypothetical protein
MAAVRMDVPPVPAPEAPSLNLPFLTFALFVASQEVATAMSPFTPITPAGIASVAKTVSLVVPVSVVAAPTDDHCLGWCRHTAAPTAALAHTNTLSVAELNQKSPTRYPAVESELTVGSDAEVKFPPETDRINRRPAPKMRVVMV